MLRRPLAGLLVVVALAGAGCSEDDKEAKVETNVETLLDRAFSRPLDSADLNLDARLELDGFDGLERPLRLHASGPYVRRQGTLPRFDLDLRVGLEGAGQSVESGFLSTGKRTYMKFGGQFYEQPRRLVTRTNRRLQESRAKGTLEELGLRPRRWVVDAAVEGEETVAGVRARHVSGRLAVRRVLADLNRLVERAGGAVGGIPVGVPAPLDRDELDRVARAIEDPRFDVYVGKDDDIVRRISASVRVSVPEADRAPDGLRGGSLRFTIELARVNEDQRVDAPSRSRPFSDLAKQLGGALGPLGVDVPEPQKSEGNGASTAPREERYSECIDRAQPDDIPAIRRCSRLLR